MSKVSDLKKMWEQKSQEDKANDVKTKPPGGGVSINKPPSTQVAYKQPIVHPPPPPPPPKLPQVQIKPNSELLQKKQSNISNQSGKASSSASSKQDFKNQLENKLRFGQTLYMMGTSGLVQKNYNPNPHRSQNIDYTLTVEKQSTNFTNSKAQLQQFFGQRQSQPHAEICETSQENNQQRQKVVIQQKQYQYGDDNSFIIKKKIPPTKQVDQKVHEIQKHGDYLKNEKDHQQQFPYRDTPAFLNIEEKVVNKSDLQVRKPKGGQQQRATLGNFEDFD